MPCFSHGKTAVAMPSTVHRQYRENIHEKKVCWVSGEVKGGQSRSGDEAAVEDIECSAKRRQDGHSEIQEDANSSYARRDQQRENYSSSAEMLPRECRQKGVETGAESNFWSKVRQRRKYRCSNMFIFTAISFAIMSSASGQYVAPKFYPGFEWGGQTLIQCAQPDPKVSSRCLKFALQPDKVVPAGEHKACTGAPAQEYFCRFTPLDPQGPGCSCNGACTTYSTFWKGLPLFPAECLPVIYGLEDAWVQINMRIRHFPFVEAKLFPFMDYRGEQQDRQYIKVQMDVLFGTLDVFDSEHLCTWVTVNPLTAHDRCNVVMSTGMSSPPNGQVLTSITYEKELVDNGLVLRRRLVIFGHWLSIDLAMLALKYKADPNVNTFRMRSQLYMEQISKKYTYERMNTTVFFANLINNEPEQVGPSLLQMIHIADVNDTPQIVHPKDIYTPPEACKDPSSELESCNFGQFWAIEDSSDVMMIQGIQVSDKDIYEQCPPEGTNFECAKVDVSIIAFKGAIQLNTRSNLNFYNNFRSKIGFTSVLTDTINAVKVLYYRVEAAEIVGTASSTVLNYNTQRLGEKAEEYVTVRVSDQGFSGETGIAQFNEIRIDVVIVARNKAPTIYIGVNEFTVRIRPWLPNTKFALSLYQAQVFLCSRPAHACSRPPETSGCFESLFQQSHDFHQNLAACFSKDLACTLMVLL
jgi:hypothetical protein